MKRLIFLLLFELSIRPFAFGQKAYLYPNIVSYKQWDADWVKNNKIFEIQEYSINHDQSTSDTFLNEKFVFANNGDQLSESHYINDGSLWEHYVKSWANGLLTSIWTLNANDETDTVNYYYIKYNFPSIVTYAKYDSSQPSKTVYSYGQDSLLLSVKQYFNNSDTLQVTGTEALSYHQTFGDIDLRYFDGDNRLIMQEKYLQLDSFNHVSYTVEPTGLYSFKKERISKDGFTVNELTETNGETSMTEYDYFNSFLISKRISRNGEVKTYFYIYKMR